MTRAVLGLNKLPNVNYKLLFIFYPDRAQFENVQHDISCSFFYLKQEKMVKNYMNLLITDPYLINLGTLSWSVDSLYYTYLIHIT